MNLSLRRQTPAATMRRPRALVASAKSGNPDRNRGNDSGRLSKLHQPWQLRALSTYDTVPECWYPSQFYARSMSKTRYFPAILNDRGEPEEQEDGPLVDLFDRIRDPDSSGRSSLAASYGRLQFLNGDGYLVVTGDDDGESWEYLSVAELRVDPEDRPGKPQTYRRLRAQGGTAEELSEADDSDFGPLSGKNVRVYRLWRPHPAHSQQADAPIRAVLDLYELLHRLTLAAGAEAQSRAAQRGIFFIANEIRDQITLGPDDDPQSDPFLRAFEEALENAIVNPGTAGAMSPIIVSGPAAVSDGIGGKIPLKDALGWFPLGPSDRYAEGEMWEKTINRIGNGLDMPRETLTGEGRNHWGDWLVDEQGYRQHIAPVTQRFCDDIAAAYLRPAAKDDSIPDWERVVVGYDPADAILHPDRAATAKDAHDRLTISDARYRQDGGYTEEDAPDDEELARRTLIMLHRVPPGIDTGDPAAETAPQDGGGGGDTVEQPPPVPTNGNGQAAVTAAALQAAKILGAAEFQVERARELAGNRLRRRSQSCVECKDKIELVPSALVAAALGHEQVLSVIDGHVAESQLVAGIGAGLANKLRTWGIDGEWPEQLGVLVEQHALRTLYEEVPPPLPPGFMVAVTKALR